MLSESDKWDTCRLGPLSTFQEILYGVFFSLAKQLEYGKPRLGESTLTKIGPDTPNLAKINLFVLGTSTIKKTPRMI